jgi:hypothetical protein
VSRCTKAALQRKAPDLSPKSAAAHMSHSTLALLVLTGLIAAFLGALRHRDLSRIRTLLTEREEARMEISDLEGKLERERLVNYVQAPGRPRQ